MEHQIASTRGDRLAEQQIAEELSELAREAEDDPSAQPTSMETSGAQPATNHQLAKRRYVPFVCCLLAAAGAWWWWSSSANQAMTAPSDPAPPTHGPREAAAPKEAVPSAIVSDLAQQFQSMTRDLAAMKQAIEQLKVTQDKLVRDNEDVASQLAASKEEIARNNRVIDGIKAIQTQMARDSQTLTDRLNANQEELARVTANASAPKEMMPEVTNAIPEEPRVIPQVPLPRPRQPANVAQAPKPAPTPPRPQVKKPQSSLAWPWSR